MGMVIHDDFWEAAQALPEKQRAPFLYALMEYRFEGTEPTGKPPWLPVFIAVKARLELGDEASERGRRMARARWGKKRTEDAEHQPHADADAPQHVDAQAHAQASNSSDAEVEVEIGVGEPPYSPPMHGTEDDATFGLRCLAQLNDALGTSFASMPPKCSRTLERFEGTYSADQVGGMVRYKRDEWTGTRWRGCLTPNTLFSPEHFEQYMAQAEAEEREVAGYAIYD